MNRKLFLKNLFFLTGGVLAGGRIFSTTFKPRKVRGRVRNGSKGLANVIVSDGFSVVPTDRKGRYEFTTHESAQFITVSVPAGFQFLQENNITRCYQPIGEKKETYDFELQPLSMSDEKHRFIIWADPQVKNEKDVEKMMTQSVPDMLQHFSEKDNVLLHGITVGDIVWDEHSLYKDYNAAVDKMKIPFFQVLGNHDMDYKGSDDSVSDVTFKAHYGPTYYSFNRGKVHYVVLDDVRYLGKERHYDGFIPEYQLEWLKKDLAFVPKDHLVVVCLHIPVYSSVVNRDAFYEIIRPWKTHIMSGHTHTNNNVENGNVYEHVHGTVCGAWWTGPICGDGTPPGYAVYDVEGADLKWYYKPVGKELNYQSTIFMQTNAAGQREMVANVWNWDPSWKVIWQADDSVKGELFSIEDFDPLAVSLYKGDQLPAGRPFVEPRKTKHIFKTIIPDGVSSVKLMATDRFGNRYETMARVNA